MARDIDYAAVTVRASIVEKFGRHNDLAGLNVVANENTISVLDGDHAADGTRDNLLAAIRAADSYEKLWEVLAARD